MEFPESLIGRGIGLEGVAERKRGEKEKQTGRREFELSHHGSYESINLENPPTEVLLEQIALFRREKVDGFPKIFPATATTLKVNRCSLADFRLLAWFFQIDRVSQVQLG